MAKCKKCHRFIKKRNLNHHTKNCVPSRKDMEHYQDSKGLSVRALENKKKKQSKKV